MDTICSNLELIKVSKYQKSWLIEDYFTYFNEVNGVLYGPFQGFNTGELSFWEVGQVLGGN